MNKLFNKAVLNGTTVMGDGLTYPRIPNVYTGDNEGGYQRGDMMDANAVVEMIKELTDTGKITIDELKNLINEEIQERVEGDQDQQRYTDEKIKDLIGTSPETLDTLKEIADALGEDPDFAANVWNKIAELTTKHDADIQELQDAITSGFENIDFTPYVKKTDVVTNTTNGLMLASDKTKLDAFEEADQYAKAPNIPKYIVGQDVENSVITLSFSSDKISINFKTFDLINNHIRNDSFVIPKAMNYSAGLMSSSDKDKLDKIPTNMVTDISNYTTDPSYIRINYSTKSLDLPYGTTHHMDIISATQSNAGVMSASDKVKLDSLINYQAGNGINITGDTISCTLDTSLYFVVTELPETGLPNKIYLLPSTETEEGNIYTEYGYVDNKWEELGKYKADVDLSPYERALNLPSDVIKTLGVLSGANYVNIYSYKEDLDRGVLSEVSEFDIPKATSENAGIITAQDKTKLDGIETGAQVNKIESVSVNGTPLEITNKDVDIPNATTEKDGMMSKADKTKLDSLENYTLPAATDTTLGGIKVPKTYKRDGYPDYYTNELKVTEEGNLILKSMSLGDVTKPFGPQLGLNIHARSGTVLEGFNLMNVAHLETHQMGVLAKSDFDKFNAKQDALTEVQLNNINNAITSISINNIEQVNTNGAVDLTIPNASITGNGLMSANDKSKLDSQPTIKASDATGVTDDDYVVIKKSELNSILSRLSALENKA